MVFSTCAEFVRCLVNSLESELDRVCHLCNICDRLGGQLGVRIRWCFHLCSIWEMVGEQFGIRIRWCFPAVQHLWQVWWSASRQISMVFPWL